MLMTQASFRLSITAMIVTLIACQAEVVQDSRTAATGAKAQPAVKDGDAKTVDTKAEVPAANTGNPAGTPPAAASANYTMTWDVSADPAIVSYKVFVIPPDRNPRFPGKTDVPIQIKNYPIAGLQKNGTKYTLAVSNDEIKTALGAIVVSPAAYCFTIVAVNALGNSSHSPVICP